MNALHPHRSTSRGTGALQLLTTGEGACHIFFVPEGALMWHVTVMTKAQRHCLMPAPSVPGRARAPTPLLTSALGAERVPSARSCRRNAPAPRRRQ